MANIRKTNLMDVHAQWRKRAAHERFYDVSDVIETLDRRHKHERNFLIPMDSIEVIAGDDDDGEIYLRFGGIPNPVLLTHWSFSGLCRQLGMSTHDIRNFPPRFVAPMIQYRLQHSAGIGINVEDIDESPDTDDDDGMAALFGDTLAQSKRDTQARQLNILVSPDSEGKSLVAASVTSATYGRYSNLQLARDAMIACNMGWRTPRAMSTGNNPYPAGHPQADRLATAEDLMKCSLVTEGMPIGPAGVYLGDRNMFIFLASDKEVLPGSFRFVTLENSDVGEPRNLRATFGLMNYVCMNHILWGCTNVHMVEKMHRRGSVGEFTHEFEQALELTMKSEGVPLPLYNLAKSTEIAPTREKLVDEIYSRRVPLLTKKVIEKAFDTAESNHEDADGAAPNSYWGFVQGLTRYSQTVKHADTRHALDKAGGSLLDELKLEDAAVTASVPVTIEAEFVEVAKPATKPKKSSAKK